MLDSAADGKNKLDFSKLRQDTDHYASLQRSRRANQNPRKSTRKDLMSSMIEQPVRNTVNEDGTASNVVSRTLSEQPIKPDNLGSRSLQERSIDDGH